MIKKQVILTESQYGERLDKVLTAFLNVPRTNAQLLITTGNVLVNNQVLKASYKVKADDEIFYTELEEEELTLKPYDFPLDIVFEDDDLIIINKPIGLVVHPGAGHKQDTLVNALLAYAPTLSSVNGEFRPGIVHRLDKDTSGLLIVCKNDQVHHALSKQFKNHEVERAYQALVNGSVVEEAGRIKTYLTRSKDNFQKMIATPATGKLAITNFKVLKRYPKHMLLELHLETGRTHQLRAHLEFIGCSIEGDKLYGKNNRTLYNYGQLLHAYKLSFNHPRTNKMVSFETKLPAHFAKVLKHLDQVL